MVLMMILLTGCASYCLHEGAPMSCVVSRDPRLESPTPVFGGVSADVLGIGGSLAAPVISIYDKNIRWYMIFLFPLPMIDIPCTLVLDLWYLPSDIAFWSTWSHHQERLKKYEERVSANVDNDATESH